ncbi:NifB/NifX family molybdenum-iron cluster-binding protein [Anaerosalibacter bizertensis]|uniref:NifB/NifX family molybdenum-iron cluster-binding protein n=1 Tax=Anaerosalibacter bizertensis TaxID=932217 RepID=UPI001C0F19D7|nr:NifB/NifX family molybdenum-iron cluster-binding protein [Anaerosalibacter bizertensis]MBU5293923.1 NifB/NifX family molybdenum-iron cluster-binding protein [Anaerosalibacter bizertensis]
MKIGLSSNGKDLDSTLDLRFGRCSYFIIYDIEKSDFESIENKGLTSEGGAGIAASQQLIDENVDVIITGKLGPNAFNIINKADIKVFKSEAISIKDAIEKYKKDELLELKESGPAHHGM